MKNKILVIDDNSDHVDFIKLVLSKENYEILTASDGNEGIAKARESKPDIILLDIMMPGKNGFNTCKELKADDTLKKIPVLIMTAIGDHLTDSDYPMEKGLELESDEYITKPINPELLKSKVRELLVM
jgi:two-component system alkaline phosphatase synthesis response regulator PhoP